MLGVDVKRIVEGSNHHRLKIPDIRLHIELCPKNNL